MHSILYGVLVIYVLVHKLSSVFSEQHQIKSSMPGRNLAQRMQNLVEIERNKLASPVRRTHFENRLPKFLSPIAIAPNRFISFQPIKSYLNKI